MINDVPHVCCSNGVPPVVGGKNVTTEASTSTTENISIETAEEPIPEWIESLKKKLPSECGKDVKSDRIFGGKVTDIDEFPWTVLLEYLKREFLSDSVSNIAAMFFSCSWRSMGLALWR